MTAGKYWSVVVLFWLAVGSAKADTWETAGSVLALALPLTALTATYTLDDPEGRERLLVSYALTIGAAYTLKSAADVERPDGSDRLSTPSAHTASAFSGASFLQRRYGWDVGLPAYLGASYVGWSRVSAERNHVRDVLTGALLGWGINAWLVPEPHQPALALWPTEGGAVLAFEWRF
ncbi:MAG: phosphatase PAP2 family protein [Saccharospirillum sp.]|nr:phosphatase PAP2 family protein [Saccharospirillum sp.]